MRAAIATMHPGDARATGSSVSRIHHREILELDLWLGAARARCRAPRARRSERSPPSNASRIAKSARESTRARLRSSGVEIRVAARQRDAVRLAHRGRDDELESGKSRSRTIARMSVACWMSFWPKIATSGWTMLKSFATTVSTPVKWPGRDAPSHRDASAVGTTDTARPGAIQLIGLRREQEVHAARFRQSRVAVAVARIAREVLVRTELQRIDEQAHDDAAGALARAIDQREMPFVERAHRRHERDARAAAARSASAMRSGSMRSTICTRTSRARSCDRRRDSFPRAPRRRSARSRSARPPRSPRSASGTSG